MRVERGKRKVKMNISTKRAVMLGTTLVLITALFVLRPRFTPLWSPIEEKKGTTQQGPMVTVGSATVTVVVADTEALRTQGLSGKRSLAANEGMLFIFENPGVYGFWMKDMYFPIDIIWIDTNWKVSDISPGVDPNTYPQAFFPKKPVRYVLEVPSGFAKEHGISVGMVVTRKP